jgi:acyl carrier protein
MTQHVDKMEPIAGDLEDLIRELGRISPEESGFTRHSNLFFDGYLDSLGVMALISHIERTYEISLGDDALADERFGSVLGISEVIAERIEAGLSRWT